MTIPHDRELFLRELGLLAAEAASEEPRCPPRPGRGEPRPSRAEPRGSREPTSGLAPTAPPFGLPVAWWWLVACVFGWGLAYLVFKALSLLAALLQPLLSWWLPS